ncbi:MAG: hypothetical protein GX077_08910 [Tissierellia bacterium]|nr:hypothetical protein [Tissierellia bacterium]
MENIRKDHWIGIKLKKQSDKLPKEILIDINGNVYLDGELYDETKSKYKNLSIDVERHNKLSSGEETLKIIEEGKKAKKGDYVIIRDEEGPDRKEITTVKF